MASVNDAPRFSDRSYEELSVGERWGPFTESLDQATSDGLRGAVGASAPGAHAPLGILPLLTLRVLRRALDGIIPGGVLIRQSFTVVDRLPAAGDIALDVAVTAQQRRPSGFYTTFAFTLAHAGSVAAIVEWMILAPPPTEDAP
jgi:hypothetical protein